MANPARDDRKTKKDDPFRRELEELRRVRDELRLQVHLGGMEVRDLWDELEERFDSVESHARQLANDSEDALADASGALGRTLGELREEYGRLREKLATSASSDRVWERVRQTFERVVDEGYKATERVVGSLEELGDAARVRVERARLERDLLKQCAKLGTRVYELAKVPALPDGTPPQVLDDEQCRELLKEVGRLDNDLKRAVSELSGDA